MLDLEELEAKAKAAGPAWVKDGPWAETCVQPAEVLALIRELREARAAESTDPVGVRPSEPTEGMRQAAKVIDPALPNEQIRAIYLAPQPDRVAELKAALAEAKQSLTDRSLNPADTGRLDTGQAACGITRGERDEARAEVARLTAEVERLRGCLEYARDYVDSLVENGAAVHAAGLLRDIDDFLAEPGPAPVTDEARGAPGGPVL